MSSYKTSKGLYLWRAPGNHAEALLFLFRFFSLDGFGYVYKIEYAGTRVRGLLKNNAILVLRSSLICPGLPGHLLPEGEEDFG